jgi:acyl-coenzyme A synthetase/AMP-(fatty) acid ligase
LPDYKRVAGYVIWEKDFPRTASMKIKRQALGEEIGKTLDRGAVVGL